MKTIFTIFLAVLSSLIYAQIPNASFEVWTSPNQPAGWTTTNSDDPGSVIQSTDAWDGTYAIQMTVIYTSGIGSFGPTVYSADSGSFSSFFPVSSPPAALHGWYIGHNLGGDGLLLTSETVQDSYAGLASGKITDTTSLYKEFAFNYIYPSGTYADSVSIDFTVEGTDTLHPGTYFIIDDLSFGPAVTGIEAVTNEPFLEACTPNPAMNFTNIIYSIPDFATVNLSLFDITGRKVKTLLTDIRQSAGRYKIPVDVSNLPGGTYLSRLNVDGQIFTQKILVAK